jgi:trehalose-6-phosphatase
MKVVEMRWAALHKGTLVAQRPAQAAPAAWILAIGHDHTDEDMLAAVSSL